MERKEKYNYKSFTKLKKIFTILLFVFFCIWIVNCNVKTGGLQNAFGKNQDRKISRVSADYKVKAYANYCVAINLMLENNWTEAVKYLIKSMEYDPFTEKVHLYLSSCYFQLNQQDLAIAHLKEASKIKPDDFNIHYTIGNFYQANGNYDSAIQELELAIGCASENVNKALYGDALFNIANLYAKKGDMEKAISCLDAIINLKITPEPEKIFFEIARLYYENGDIKNSLDTFKLVNELAPSIHIVHLYLSACYEKLDKLEDAVLEAKIFLEKSPNAWTMHFTLNRIYEKMKKEELADSHYQKAVQILKESVNLGSKYPEEYIALGQILLNQNEKEQALNVLKKGLSITKDKTRKRDLHFLISNICYDLNKFDNVEDELKKTLEIDNNFHQANNFLGYFYAERGLNLDEAIDLIQKALDAEPDNEAYLDSLGWAYFKKAIANDRDDLIDKALKILIQASQMSSDPEIQEHTGDVYYSLGKWRNAEKEWSKALELIDEKKERNMDKVSKRLKDKLKKLIDLKFFEQINDKVLSNKTGDYK